MALKKQTYMKNTSVHVTVTWVHRHCCHPEKNLTKYCCFHLALTVSTSITHHLKKIEITISITVNTKSEHNKLNSIATRWLPNFIKRSRINSLCHEHLKMINMIYMPFGAKWFNVLEETKVINEIIDTSREKWKTIGQSVLTSNSSHLFPGERWTKTWKPYPWPLWVAAVLDKSRYSQVISQRSESV